MIALTLEAGYMNFSGKQPPIDERAYFDERNQPVTFFPIKFGARYSLNKSFYLELQLFNLRFRIRCQLSSIYLCC